MSSERSDARLSPSPSSQDANTSAVPSYGSLSLLFAELGLCEYAAKIKSRLCFKVGMGDRWGRLQNCQALNWVQFVFLHAWEFFGVF